MASARQIHVGPVPIGGGAPVAVQTMTKTETANLKATMEQIRTVAEAGADIVRVAVPREQDAEALKTIVAESPIPVIADIHRSEERRVGKECRSRGWPHHYNENRRPRPRGRA